ncbi:hypothetical protein FIBSPDRAFT_853766, partial [Athelia psychrophila]
MKSAPTTTSSVPKSATAPFSHLRSKTTPRPDSATQESCRDIHIASAPLHLPHPKSTS